MPPRVPDAVVSVLVGLLLFVGVLAARPAQAADGGWRWPLPPPQEVVRGFDPPPQPWAAGHRGVDLAGVAGETVRSAGAGTVRFAGVVAGVPVVSVGHPDGLLTTYQPVRATVRQGQAVAAGAALGQLVAQGSHCRPRTCLHWGLRRGTDYLDPLLLLGGGRVRLLPDPAAAHARSWMLPAAGGASVGSSATVAVWAVAVARRRRRPTPPGVACLDTARRHRSRTTTVVTDTDTVPS